MMQDIVITGAAKSFGEKQADQLMEAFRKVSEYYAR